MADITFDVRATFGALLVGGTVCTLLSGAVSMQAYQYARTYTNDRAPVKLLVLGIWLLDLFHTSMVATSNWDYLIESFGSNTVHDEIVWSLGVTVASTAILTFCVHCFFVHRLYKLSKGKLSLAIPIAFVALLRLMSACVTTAEMIRLGSFSKFFHQFRWVFTLGLCLSSLVDVMIASGMCFFLSQNRTGTSDLDQIINSVILYTVENGILTSIATIASLIFWLVMPHNLVYMGLHFAISKLYASSLLASLNARKSLRQVHSSIRDGPRPLSYSPSTPRRYSKFIVGDRSQTATKLEISVEKTIDCVIEDGDAYIPSYQMSERSYTPHTQDHWAAV